MLTAADLLYPVQRVSLSRSVRVSGPPPLSRPVPAGGTSLPPISSASPGTPVAARGWNRNAPVSLKDAVRAPPSAAVSSVIIPRLPSSPSGHG